MHPFPFDSHPTHQPRLEAKHRRKWGTVKQWCCHPRKPRSIVGFAVYPAGEPHREDGCSIWYPGRTPSKNILVVSKLALDWERYVCFSVSFQLLSVSLIKKTLSGEKSWKFSDLHEKLMILLERNQDAAWILIGKWHELVITTVKLEMNYLCYLKKEIYQKKSIKVVKSSCRNHYHI